MKFIIRETQNVGSYRMEYEIEASSLTSAKRVASTRQMIARTVLRVESEKGDLLSMRKGKKWEDFD